MNQRVVKIGTRGSQLALWQANEVSRFLQRVLPNIKTEIIVIKTKGDIILDVALSKIGDKGLFTKELEEALLRGEIDMAVHSLKDMPTELPKGLILGAVLPRGEVRDVFISRDGRKLSQFTERDKVATSSLRRKAQLLHHFPHLNVIDIRGNVNSRLKKMEEGHCDGLIMAGAGIQRLGFDDKISEYLDTNTIMPAVSQGAVTIEIREDDDIIQPVCDAVNDFETWQITMAERAFLRTMEGGCQVPVACFSSQKGDEIQMEGMIASLDGKLMIKETVLCEPDEASEKAVELAWCLLNAGGDRILESIRNGNE